MKTSLKWIKSLVPGIANITPREYADAMTLSGTKVEGYEKLDKNLENIIVGKILRIEKHPDADKLLICQVDVGDETVQIVTGAQNVFEGAVVPVVLDGGKVAGGHDGSKAENGIVIKKGKLRGVESNGMLCSIEELGSSRDMYPEAPENGIYIFPEEDGVKPGDDAIHALGLDDVDVEYQITSNRVDCYSVLGIAREAAATFRKPFVQEEPCVKKTEGDIHDYLDVEVMDRTGLILRIFAEQARTREARLQVEHAELQYIMPRLAGMWTHFGRQAGSSGSQSNRGIGETQLELDRRHIERRMAELEKELDAKLLLRSSHQVVLTSA